MLDHHVELGIILPTFFDARQRKDREILELLKQHFSDQLALPIRDNVSLSEAPGHHMSIYEYAPKSHGASDYAQLVERVAANGK
jgi:chromosome partitioning protein